MHVSLVLLGYCYHTCNLALDPTTFAYAHETEPSIARPQPVAVMPRPRGSASTSELSSLSLPGTSYLDGSEEEVDEVETSRPEPPGLIRKYLLNSGWFKYVPFIGYHHVLMIIGAIPILLLCKNSFTMRRRTHRLPVHLL